MLLKFNTVEPEKWPHGFSFGNQGYLMLVNPRSDKNGFEFKVLRFVSCDVSSKNPLVLDGEELRFWVDSTECEEIFSGSAYYDGIRHLKFDGEDNDGYLHCVNPRVMSEIFSKLADLVDIHCLDHCL